MKMKFHNFSSISYFRNFIFGVEDSLVSTVGLLSGVAVADVPRTTIFLTGIILLLVEGLSMAVGSFLTEYSVGEFIHQTERTARSSILSGIIMFFSYLICGFIPLFPYALWPVDMALKVSIGFSVVSLFLLGIVGAKISDSNILKSGFRMALVGGMAITIGILAGNLLSKI